MKFHLFVKEEFAELSPEGLQAGKLDFVPSGSDKLLIKIDDPDITPDDFRPGGKYIKHDNTLHSDYAGRLIINPYTMEILKESASVGTGHTSFITEEEDSGQLFFTSFFADNVEILEGLSDEEAILYYEVN